MPFEKGQSGNPAGKPQGAKNKVGVQLRETISDFLSNNFSKVEEDFHALKPKDRVKLYCDLLQYGLPRLQSISAEIEQSVSMGFNFEKFTDQDLEKILKDLTTIANDERNEQQEGKD